MMQSAAVQHARHKTWTGYQGGQPLKDSQIRKKIYKTKIATGSIKQVDGATLREWSDRLDVSYSAFQSTLKHQGLDAALALTKRKSSLETLVESWLQDVDVVINKRLHGTSYRPDILVPASKLIIEVDGLYWHSDAVIQDKTYHKNKMQAYKAAGFASCFIRADELLNKPDIVKSMLRHRLGRTQARVYARACDLISVSRKTSQEFLSKHHLMGAANGFTLALTTQGQPVAMMQFRRRKANLEIARYCSAKNNSVVGGFSRLLKAGARHAGVYTIETFCDLRYGDPTNLELLGFTHKNTSLSFVWTDGRRTMHRMQFPGNSGYEKNLQKIWDCGQALYIKQMSKP
ncbi:hypothetical protein HC928_02355 [bacterium]|nr:hypothetical protein [bacterium]